MKTHTRILALSVAAALSVGALVAGCSSEPEGPVWPTNTALDFSTPSPVPESASPSPSPTGPLLGPDELSSGPGDDGSSWGPLANSTTVAGGDVQLNLGEPFNLAADVAGWRTVVSDPSMISTQQVGVLWPRTRNEEIWAALMLAADRTEWTKYDSSPMWKKSTFPVVVQTGTFRVRTYAPNGGLYVDARITVLPDASGRKRMNDMTKIDWSIPVGKPIYLPTPQWGQRAKLACTPVNALVRHPRPTYKVADAALPSSPWANAIPPTNPQWDDKPGTMGVFLAKKPGTCRYEVTQLRPHVDSTITITAKGGNG